MKLKWDISGKGEEAWGSDFTQYTGEVPPRGSYVAKIKRMTVGKIKKEGENQGKPRISVLLEVVGGAGSVGLNDEKYPYYGAPIWESLNIIKPQAGKVNGFLHALTDGSEEAKRAIETAFWPPNGPDAKKEARRDGTEEIHIKAIGKYKIESPTGEHLVRIVTKMGKDLQKQDRAEVNQFLPYTGPRPASSVNGKVDDESGLEPIEDDEIIDASSFLSSTEDITDLDTVDAVEEPPF